MWLVELDELLIEYQKHIADRKIQSEVSKKKKIKKITKSK